MSNQLLQAAINAKEALEYMYDLYGNADCRGNGMDEMLESAIEQLDAAIAIVQRQADMQAADTYEAQFAPESFDSAEGSPICDGCGCEMIAVFSYETDQIIGYTCMECPNSTVIFEDELNARHLQYLATLRQEWRI